MKEATRETVSKEKQNAETRDGCNGDMKHGHYCSASNSTGSETEKHCLFSDVELRVSQAGVLDGEMAVDWAMGPLMTGQNLGSRKPQHHPFSFL